MSTYSNIYLQIVFAVNGRQNILAKQWRQNVFKYISGIITRKNQKSIIVNGVTDHVHCFVGLQPNMLISDLVRDVKNNTSNFINDSGYTRGKFNWQDGYGVFSYSHDQIDSVYQYISNQEEHHRKITFREEYLQLLEDFDIDYKPEYLFNWIE